MATDFKVETLRQYFPALKQNQIFFDNAGGAQVLGEVVTSISEYLLKNNVQHGGTYATSEKCMDIYAQGYQAVADYINASTSEIVFGSSTTQLFRNLSSGLAPGLQPGDELVLSNLDHEANIAPWVQMAEWRGLTVKWWTSSNPENPVLDPKDLAKLLSPRTKLVACTHASNILGTITDIKAIANVVHSVPGAKLCVDGVAYAPHRPLDMKDLGVDFYCFSWYKVYGPHFAMLYAATDAHSSLTPLAHFFKTKSAGPHSLSTMFDMSGGNYELISTLPKITAYLSQPGLWASAISQEERLQITILDYLNSEPDVFTVYGSREPSYKVRVPVISFAVRGWKSKDVVQQIQTRSTYGLKWGHNYSYRLISEVMKFGEEGVEDGVVRISLTHYNTVEEIEGFISVLEEVLRGRPPLSGEEKV